MNLVFGSFRIMIYGLCLDYKSKPHFHYVRINLCLMYSIVCCDINKKISAPGLTTFLFALLK